MIVCKLCGKSFKGSIASHLYWIHNTNKEKYLEKFPNAEIVSSKWKERQIESHLGQEAWNKDLTKETDRRVKKQSETQKGIEFTEEHCQNISETKIKQFQNQEFARKMFTNFKNRPTNPEIEVMEILKKYYPTEWKYVGDGSVIIEGKSPDFINVNGQKKIIEVFGCYWHSEEFTGHTEDIEETVRIQYFKKYGYSTLIIWDDELRDSNKLIQKIKEFANC